MGLVFAGILLGNTQSTNRAEWSGYSLAAQAQALQRIELARAASWDTQALIPTDQISSVAGTNVGVMDIPISGTNLMLVTNITTVTPLQISSNPAVFVKVVSVSTIWNWRNSRLFTNTLVTYRAPDQ
jgi:hypothetical protein